MERKIADCRRFESENDCSLTLIGDEHEVLSAAVDHAVAVHGHQDTSAFRDQLRTMLEPESSYVAGERRPDPVAS